MPPARQRWREMSRWWMSDLRSWHDITSWYDSTAALTFLHKGVRLDSGTRPAVTEAKEKWGG